MPELQLERAEWGIVSRAIRQVSHYCQAASIRQEELPIDLIRPICRLARTYRLERARHLLRAYDRSDVVPYAGVFASTSGTTKRLIVPPIVEIHGEEHVLIDGLHRTLLASDAGRREMVVVCITGNLPPLPGDPLNWESIQTISHHTPREAKFENYRPEHFRRISCSLVSYSTGERMGTIGPGRHEDTV